MGSCSPEIVHDVPPYIRVYADGTVERLVATEVTPAGFDSDTGVFSKDVIVNQETGVTARLYRPNNNNNNNPNLMSKTTQSRLPLVIYFHGGAFCVATAFEPKYHNFVNKLVSEANVMAISVDYRRVPEHPLPAVYEDSWEVLKWVSSHNNYSSGDEDGAEDWIRDGVDFGKVFLAGDSAGANISHHMAIRNRAGSTETGVKSSINIEFRGIIMIHPYFWGEKPVGLMEIKDPIRKAMVDKWWKFVCPSDKGCDDPLINPFVNNNDSYEISAGHSNLGCKRILICVAENDILNERGKMYYRSLIRSKNWKGKAEIVETEGEDHVFHIFNPSCEKAEALVKKCAAFLNQY